MKKVLASLLVMMACTAAYAQPTIEAADAARLKDANTAWCKAMGQDKARDFYACDPSAKKIEDCELLIKRSAEEALAQCVAQRTPKAAAKP